MVWVLLVVTGVLAVLVGVLARRVHRLERRLDARPLPSSDPIDMDFAPVDLQIGSLDEKPQAATEYVITRVGEPEPDVEAASEPVPTVPAPVFADLVLKETVVQTASLFHGLRRALAPETRNRI